MDGVRFIEPTRLYNLLNQAFNYPSLSDPKYLLLLDIREEQEYAESHIVTARLVRKDEEQNFELPQHFEVDTKQHIVIYATRSTTLTDPNSLSVAFAHHLWKLGSKYPVNILRGGYQEFSALFPFLRTQTTMYTPRELDNLFVYPIEVIPKFLYMGNWSQSQDKQVNKHLKIKAHLNVTKNYDEMFIGRDFTVSVTNEELPRVMNIAIEDDEEADAYGYFQDACDFIKKHTNGDGQAILIMSDLGISRCAVFVIAYLMATKEMTLKEAWSHLKECKPNIRPMRSFVQQLSRWEQHLNGTSLTDVSDPYY